MSNKRQLIIITIISIFIITFICFQCSHRSLNQKQLVLIGLDGAAWKFIDPLLKAKQLPTFQRLIDHGVRCDLETLLPTQSVIIWNTIVTGCMPAKHGIKGWLSGAGDQLAITSLMRQEPALWDIFSYNYKKGFYLNWWSSWPTYPIKGVMISNLFFYPETPKPVYPQSLTEKLRRMVSIESANPEGKSENSVSETSIYRRDAQVFKLAEFLVKQEKVDIVALYVRGLDMTEHEYYWYSFPQEFTEPPHDVEMFRHWIDEYYILLDKQIGQLLSNFTSPVDVIIVSDHGMEAKNSEPASITKLLINNLLSDLGYVTIKNQYELDWSKTKVYQYGYHHPGQTRKLRLNLIGREESGTIEPEMKEKTIENVVTLLKGINVEKSEESGTMSPLFLTVERSDDGDTDIVCQLNLSILPEDILILPAEKKKVDHYLTHFLVHSSGQHDQAPAGICIMSGPSIINQAQLDRCHVTDILPTILRISGLPISSEMDGRVLDEILIPEIKNQKLITVNSYPLPEIVTRNEEDEGNSIPNSVENKIRQNLQSLGYIQ